MCRVTVGAGAVDGDYFYGFVTYLVSFRHICCVNYFVVMF